MLDNTLSSGPLDVYARSRSQGEDANACDEFLSTLLPLHYHNIPDVVAKLGNECEGCRNLMIAKKIPFASKIHCGSADAQATSVSPPHRTSGSSQGPTTTPGSSEVSPSVSNSQSNHIPPTTPATPSTTAATGPSSPAQPSTGTSPASTTLTSLGGESISIKPPNQSSFTRRVSTSTSVSSQSLNTGKAEASQTLSTPSPPRSSPSSSPLARRPQPLSSGGVAAIVIAVFMCLAFLLGVILWQRRRRDTVRWAMIAESANDQLTEISYGTLSTWSARSGGMTTRSATPTRITSLLAPTPPPKAYIQKESSTPPSQYTSSTSHPHNFTMLSPPVFQHEHESVCRPDVPSSVESDGFVHGLT
ncbi:hypothetical protein C8Q80DRAFT_1145565 [Daedaleopsis nitida]|nr:hypothetical protein C8Q80DRAFT_1145565 [Daedaleopsis nitida]